MANVLAGYNPTFFAQESLGQLYNKLGMASRVYLGLNNERGSDQAGYFKNKGETVTITGPGKFKAQEFVEGTGTTAQDITGLDIDLKLEFKKEVKFKITGKQMAFTQDRIVNEHVTPAVEAIAEAVDTELHKLGNKVAPKVAMGSTVNSSYILDPRKVLASNKAPMGRNGVSEIYYGIDVGVEHKLLDLSIIHDASVTGNSTNPGLNQGAINRPFGVNVFTTHGADLLNSQMTSTATASAGTGDIAGAVNNASGYEVNTSTIAIDGLTGTQTFKIGDTFSFAGSEYKYILTADETLVAGAGSFTFYPPLRENVADNDVVNFDLLDAVQENAAGFLQNLMFHRNAFAIVFAPLPENDQTPGADVTTIIDQQTGISIRARMWYEPGIDTHWVALDVLFGVQVLDTRLAVRVLRATTTAPA